MSIEQTDLLEPLREDIVRLEQTLQFLQSEDEPAMRADLADELVVECALIEDTKERALFPFLEGLGFTEAARRMRDSTDKVRGAMEPVFLAVRHMAPVNVHHHEPEIFEHDVEQLCRAIVDHRDRETTELVTVNARLSTDQRRLLAEHLRLDRRHAVARPHPPHNFVLRLFERLVDGVDRRFPDTAEQYHPGRDKLAG